LSISSNDAERLRAAGFLDQEIYEIASATTPDGQQQPPIDLDSQVWQNVLESRVKWIEQKLADGWNEERIREEIMAYYRRGTSRNPFDFLKAEYRPPKRVDYWEAMRRKKQAGIKNTIEGYGT